MVTPSRDQLIETARSLFMSYNSWDLDTIIAPRADDCVQHTLPESRNQPPRNNEQYREFFTTKLPLYQNFTVTVLDKDTFVDTEQRKVHMHVKSKADTAIGPYGNEYDFTVRMNETGDKVQEVWEFIDTQYAEEFTAKLLKAHGS